MQQQHRQQRSLLAATEGDPAALVEDLERTEDAELHASSGVPGLEANVQ